FFFALFAALALLSFPTRRSSDLKPGRANEEVYAVLISDVHVGSKVFMEDAFGRVLGWLKGEVGGPDQRHISDHVKYVLIGGDLVDRKSTRLNSSHVAISYAVFCL